MRHLSKKAGKNQGLYKRNLRFVPALVCVLFESWNRQGTIQLDKVNIALAMFGMEAGRGKRRMGDGSL